MAAILSSGEEVAVQEFVSVVNCWRLQQDLGPLSWGTAVKFMMARKFDTRRALHLYEAHEILRRNEGLVKFDPNSNPLKSELETGKFTILPTRDRGGAALALFTAGKHNPFHCSHQATLQGIMYQLDVALENFETQRYGIVFIYNMTESKYSNFDYDLSQKLLTILKGCYPARLKKVLIVTAPLWFKAPFKILRLFVGEKLRDRVYMVNVPQLTEHIPLSSLPRKFGGDLMLNHDSWLLHCLKSMTNRCEDISGLISAPTSPTVLPNGQTYMPIIQNKALPRDYIGLQSSEGEIESECSEHQTSLREKRNFKGQEVEAIKLQASKLAENSDNGFYDEPLSSSSPASSLSDESLHTDGGLTLFEFIEHLQQKGKRGLIKEYAELKAARPEGTFENSRLKCNQPKNRYTDVLCFDHSRVKIPLQDMESTDYMNANYVDGYRQKKAFISTQGPLPKTFVDFWSMIWEEQVGVIVMTTRTIERSRMKCGQYWPNEDESSVEHGPFLIYNSGSEEFTDYILTNLVFTNVNAGKFYRLYHLQFTSWPDYGVPQSALAMLKFRDIVREKQRECLTHLASPWLGHPQGPPILVHCSAGIGRTGTFITLDISIHRLEATALVDVHSTVKKIRSQRAFSIQMPEQYVFCHLALLEFALSRGLLHDVDLSTFNNSESESE